MTRPLCHKCHRSQGCSCWNGQAQIVEGILSFAADLSFSDKSFDAATFQALARAEETHFWFTERRKLLLWALNRYFPKASSFLEIGCGAGYVLEGIVSAHPQLTVAGSELLVQGLKLAAAKLPEAVTLYQMDARDLPFSEDWDVIGAFDVIEHIAEDETVLHEMYRACRTGGGILLSVPQHPWLWSDADTAAHHVRRYRAVDLVRKVEDAGFRIVRKTSFITALLPALAVMRRSHSQKPYDLVASLKVSPLSNTIDVFCLPWSGG